MAFYPVIYYKDDDSSTKEYDAISIIKCKDTRADYEAVCSLFNDFIEIRNIREIEYYYDSLKTYSGQVTIEPELICSTIGEAKEKIIKLIFNE